MPRYHGRGSQTPTDLPLATKQQVIEAFCELVGRVNSNGFQWSHPSDCFCAIGDEHPSPMMYSFSPQVFDFIADAVMAATRTEVAVRQRIREAVLDERDTNGEQIDELEAQLAMMKLP